MGRKRCFVEVVLPLPLEAYYSYEVPEALHDKAIVGCRVIAQFGRKRFYSALIRKVTADEPQGFKPKFIEDIIDDAPVATNTQYQLWDWIAGYYICKPGEVMHAALPSGLKLSSETVLHYNPEKNPDDFKLSDAEFTAMEAMRNRKSMSLYDLADLLERKQVYPIYRSLIEKGLIESQEQLNERYKPRYEKYIELHENMQDEDLLSNALDRLSTAPKQLMCMMALLDMQRDHKRIKKATLIKRSSSDSAVVKRLCEKGILNEVLLEVSRIRIAEPGQGTIHPLNEHQEEALGSIKKQWKEKSVVLLHGVTASGKTHIYFELIKDAIADGKQVLFLLPEIALTSQLTSRLQTVFGDRAGVYHSKFSSNERVEIWNKVIKQEYDVVLGARSALLLPFKNLGLIIADEEHDQSFKQFDPAPRYQARDLAVVLANMCSAKVLLGTATPSMESYINSLDGKYGYVRLSKRFGGMLLPEIKVINMAEERRKARVESYFAKSFLAVMKEALENREQIILFRNRRGFASFVECGDCEFTPECENCDVTLTYHKFSDQLVCHYCGFRNKGITKCPACQSGKILVRGFGTEKIEDEIEMIFPDASVARLDLDTARSKNAFEKIITGFEDREYDVLVGTQMVTKGLDFDNVSIVGVVNADKLTLFPDFRSHERAFQLLSQVSGRAGRKKKQGRVYIQTSKPDMPLIQDVINNNFKSFAVRELQIRKEHVYPPYYRLIRVDFKHRDKNQTAAAAALFARMLREKIKNRVLGPAEGTIPRIRNQYIYTLMIKMRKEAKEIAMIKQLLRDILDYFKTKSEHKSVRINIDVDP